MQLELRAQRGGREDFQGYCNGSNNGAPGLTWGCFDDPVSLGTMGTRANDDSAQKIVLASCNGGTINEDADPGDPSFSARGGGTSPGADGGDLG